MNFHGTEVRQKALTLLRGGSKNAEVATTLNVPLGTIGYWKHMDRAKRGECPGAHNPAVHDATDATSMDRRVLLLAGPIPRRRPHQPLLRATACPA